ncbi:hypothetical protein V6Z11_A13G180600 [Gossypium hirsutum]
MAMLNLLNSPFCISNSGGRVVRNRVLPPAIPTFIHASSKQESKAFDTAKETIKGVNETKEATKNMKDSAISAASQVSEKAKGMAEKATDAAKQVWDTAIETAQKAKETVLGKADESKGGIKENKENS